MVGVALEEARLKIFLGRLLNLGLDSSNIGQIRPSSLKLGLRPGRVLLGIQLGPHGLLQLLLLVGSNGLGDLKVL